MITNLIKPRMRKLILNHLIGNDSPEFHNGLLGSYFFKLNLGSDCWNFLFLRSPFQNHLDLISQKQRSLSNLSFKHNSANMPPLNLTSRLSFEPRFCINIYYIQKANTCSSWTPCYIRLLLKVCGDI